MTNTTVDFNNAVIEQISQEEEDLRIKFSGANIHPIDDPATGRKQNVEIYLKNVKIIGDFPELPMDLDDCYILVDMRPTTMPIPSERSAAIELQLVFSSGALVINSQHIQLTPIGEPDLAGNSRNPSH